MIYLLSLSLFVSLHQQDKLSVALDRVQLQTEEATVFQKQTNDKILFIKVSVRTGLWKCILR